MKNNSYQEETTYARVKTGAKETRVSGPVSHKIDPSKARFPFCIVWTPLPLISWIFPFIGHTGICTSDGVIHDFAGPYYVSVDDMAFGEPHKYVPLRIEKGREAEWDHAI